MPSFNLADLPEELDFHLPGKLLRLVQLKLEDEDKLYRQLVCWCLIQRYWYYCLSNPQVTDHEYDYYEEAVKALESEYGLTNPYSPTVRVGSHWSGEYPTSVRSFFGMDVLGIGQSQYKTRYFRGKATDSVVFGYIPACTCEHCEQCRVVLGK